MSSEHFNHNELFISCSSFVLKYTRPLEFKLFVTEKKKHSREDEEVMKRSQVCLIEVNQNTNCLICPLPPHPSDTITLSDIKVFASC